MRRSWWLLVIVPLLSGQGCPNPIEPETRTARAYRVCQSELGISADRVETVFTAARADLRSGYTYSELIQSGFDGCDRGCGYVGECGLSCKDCLGAVAEAVYYGDSAATQKEILDARELSASTDCELTPSESARWSELFGRLANAQPE